MHCSRMRTARSLPYGRVSVRETPLNREPLPFGQTDTCENITLPQTTFADGNDNVNGWQTLQCF